MLRSTASNTLLVLSHFKMAWLLGSENLRPGVFFTVDEKVRERYI
jgi:hypothetical protein